jgi:hypothetical protein
MAKVWLRSGRPRTVRTTPTDVLRIVDEIDAAGRQ